MPGAGQGCLTLNEFQHQRLAGGPAVEVDPEEEVGMTAMIDADQFVLVLLQRKRDWQTDVGAVLALDPLQYFLPQLTGRKTVSCLSAVAQDYPRVECVIRNGHKRPLTQSSAGLGVGL